MNIPTAFENYSKTMYDFDKENRTSQSIFVSIVSYRDPNIINTIQSLAINAKRPENITVSVVASAYMNPEKWINELKGVTDNILSQNKIKIILNVVEASKIYNLGELKNISHQEYNKEDFYMSISSSSEFDPDWDDILIKQFNTLASMRHDDDFIFSVEPRGFIPHDNIVPGYVFFTNHKTKVSFQREDYDGARVVISGYNKFMDEQNVLPGRGLYSTDEMNENLKQTLFAEKFLKDNGFVIFNKRKFLKDEYISISSGVSEKFIFSDAKKYFKINKIDDHVIDKEDFNFMSYINFVENNISVLSIRWCPVYHLYDDQSFISINRPTPKDNYEEKNISESISYIKIKEKIQSLLNSSDNHLSFSITNNLSVDWDNKVFKQLNIILTDDIVSGINSFVSFYNFSINENSLHWNNRLIK